MFPDLRKSIAFLKIARLRTFILPEEENLDDKDLCNDTDKVKLKYSDKNVTVPLCPPQISHRLAWNRNSASALTGRQLRTISEDSLYTAQ
jgi:hypothetical protein